MLRRRFALTLASLGASMLVVGCYDDDRSKVGNRDSTGSSQETVERALDWDVVKTCIRKGPDMEDPKELPDWLSKEEKERMKKEVEIELDRLLSGRAISYGTEPTLECDRLKDLLTDLHAYTEDGRLFDGEGREIRFLDEGGPDLLFLDNEFSKWKKAFERLSKHYHVVGIEYPVYGSSIRH
jgi:hypothetical protein